MKILFFSPHAEIWVHAFPEAILAKQLKDIGHEIYYIHCGRLLEESCIPMQGRNIEYDAPKSVKNKICSRCERNAKLIKSSFDLNGNSLQNLIDPSIKQQVKEITQNFRKENILSFKIEGHFIGRYALHEFLLKHKITDLDLNEALFKEYMPLFENCLLTWFAAKKHIKNYKPDIIIAYNNEYSVNRTFSMAGKSENITHYYIHAGPNFAHRLDTLQLAKGTGVDLKFQKRKYWENFKILPTPVKMIEKVTNHNIELITGNSVFVYSEGLSKTKATTLRERFKIKENQKILVAVTSSTDETFAFRISNSKSEQIEPEKMMGGLLPDKEGLFKSQYEWLKWLIKFMPTQPDLFLIIRVHPRHFPNKREGFLSEQALGLQSILNKLPSNVAVNWPSDKIPMFDIAKEIDVLLNAWSSVGMDMSILGLPAVLYSEQVEDAPSNLFYMGLTEESYIEAIHQAIKDGWSFERSRNAYRNSAYWLERVPIPIGDVYTGPNNTKQQIHGKIISKIIRILDPTFFQRKDLKFANRKMQSIDEFNDVLMNKYGSVLEANLARVTEKSDIETETAFLKKEHLRLRDHIFQQKFDWSNNKLYQRLSGK